MKNHPAFNEKIMSWQATEFHPHNRGRIWEIIAFVSVILVAIMGIIFDSWTFSLAILVFAAVYYLVHHRGDHDIIEISISPVGIQAGIRRYPYREIKSFWFVYDPPYVKKMVLHVPNEFIRHIDIHLHDQDPILIRNLLEGRIVEIKDKKEPLSDTFLRLFKL